MCCRVERRSNTIQISSQKQKNQAKNQTKLNQEKKKDRGNKKRTRRQGIKSQEATNDVGTLHAMYPQRKGQCQKRGGGGGEWCFVEFARARSRPSGSGWSARSLARLVLAALPVVVVSKPLVPPKPPVGNREEIPNKTQQKKETRTSSHSSSSPPARRPSPTPASPRPTTPS